MAIGLPIFWQTTLLLHKEKTKWNQNLYGESQEKRVKRSEVKYIRYCRYCKRNETFNLDSIPGNQCGYCGSNNTSSWKGTLSTVTGHPDINPFDMIFEQEEKNQNMSKYCSHVKDILEEPAETLGYEEVTVHGETHMFQIQRCTVCNKVYVGTKPLTDYLIRKLQADFAEKRIAET